MNYIVEGVSPTTLSSIRVHLSNSSFLRRDLLSLFLCLYATGTTEIFTLETGGNCVISASVAFVVVVATEQSSHLFGACGNTGFRYNTIETDTFFR